MKKQAHIFFTGTVQGVGFRYTTRHIANRLGITGWVRNMLDGKVEAIAEGDEETVKTFIDSLNERFSGYIKNSDVTWGDSTDEFSTFDVRL